MIGLETLRALRAIPDRKFRDVVDGELAFEESMKERGRWRDRHGVMHVLAPNRGFEVMTGKSVIAGWRVVCGYPRCSNKERDPKSVVTCVLCLGEVDEP
jgi:hypothetical protein